MSSCMLCPRMCGAERNNGQRGICGAGNEILLARAALHMWEVLCFTGTRGSGTVFFSGCQLGCVFCQNYKISAECFGLPVTEERLAGIFLSLQEQGAHNINLVSAAPYTEAVLRVLDRIRGRELTVPVVWNSGGYERVETLKRLNGYVDIYLPDYKYHSAELAKKYSAAADYPDIALAAISEMVRQTGKYVLDDDGIMTRGCVIRHLVMPGGRHDSIACVDDIAQNFGTDEVLLSLMSQYTPFYRAEEFPEINRRVTTFEYESVCKKVREYGFRGFFQEKSSAKEEYTPPFDLEGVLPT